MNITFIKRYVLLIGIVWSLACAFALISHFRDDYQQAVNSAQTRAKTMLERDILYRDWVASHGGVYVPVSEASPPNPHLEFLPERDIKTVDGRHLTLVNPAYMTRLAFEQDNHLGGTISKITSLKYLNPDNAPDPWEKSALLQLEEGGELISGVADINEQPYMRVLRPFYIEPTCLKCHAVMGYQLGDVRGGLSISIPLEPFLSGPVQHNLVSITLFTLLWLVGLAGVVLLGRKLYSQTCQAVESERQRDHAEMSLAFLSNYDRRTNLPNRFKFEELLFDTFQKVDGTGGSVAVIALEVRNYKQIVDNFSHPVGDALLKMMAEQLSVLLTSNDAIARFGEDQLLFTYVCQDGNTFSEDWLQQLLAAASKPLILENHTFFPVIGIGATLYPDDAVDAKGLVQKAASALSFCLVSKQSGVQLYSQSLQEEAKRNLEIERGLRSALAVNGFELFLQPQVDAASGALVGAEALLRWQHEDLGNVSPAEFIPVAEETGLILPIGEWVLQTACIQAIRLHEIFGRIIPIGVNVSAKQFQDPSFIDIVDEVLAIDGMLPEMIEIEITEGTFIEDLGKTIEILTDLKVRNLQIAIDDFGTGYSSLSYLSKFPIDRLKIDRSFVIAIADNKDDRILAGLIAEMGRKLGLNVIAEGVEDEVQRQLLVGMGCHAIQGYLFSRPLPFDGFCAWVENQHSD